MPTRFLIIRLLLCSSCLAPFAAVKTVFAQASPPISVKPVAKKPVAVAEKWVVEKSVVERLSRAEGSQRASQPLVYQRGADIKDLGVLESPKAGRIWPVLKPHLRQAFPSRGMLTMNAMNRAEDVKSNRASSRRGEQKPAQAASVRHREEGDRSPRPATLRSQPELRQSAGGGDRTRSGRDAEPKGSQDTNGNRFRQRIAVGRASTLQVQGERTLPFETDLKLNDEYKARYELNFQQALVRSPQQEFSMSFGVAYRDEVKGAPPGAPLPPLRGGASGASSPPSGLGLGAPSPLSLPGGASSGTGEQRTTVLQFGQDYARRDRSGAWQLASRLNFGTGLLDATATTDDSADGQFFSWKGEVRRSQFFSPNHQLSLKLSTQLSPDALMGSEQFKIGNGPKIEGLRVRDDRGDNGIRFALEDRLTLARYDGGQPLFELMPLVDVGYVWNQAGGTAPPDRATEALCVFGGVGFSWSPGRESNVGVTVRVPLFYANDIDETAADKDSTLKFSYRQRW